VKIIHKYRLLHEFNLFVLDIYSLPKVQEATEQMTDADFEAMENIEVRLSADRLTNDNLIEKIFQLDTIDEIFACGETDQARVLQDEISRGKQG